MFGVDGRRADKEQLCAGAAPAEGFAGRRVYARLSAAHLIFPLPAFVCQVPRVPVCSPHLGHAQVSASAVTPAQL